MRLFHYIEIENFKTFGRKVRVDLDHPSVLIGPNNCGKTSVIQAMALWSQAVKAWYEGREKSKARKRVAVPINRLNIVAVPVQRTRFFWHDAKVRLGTKDVPLLITVGVEFNGKVEPLTMRFRNQGEDIIYCAPEEDGLNNMEMLAYAASINVNLLYCMSGLETDEAILKPTRIDMHLGKGQTAQVLRNLCLMVYQNSTDDWQEITAFMERLFQVQIGVPKENIQGAIDLMYAQEGVKESLEIAASGRGFQQMLLVLGYLYSHKRSVLLIDEPDAHLEILRQKQVFVLLRDIASKNNSQVVVVTHSEVVLDESLDTNLTLLLEGRAENLAKKVDIRQSLRIYGAEHYIRARARGYVLYLEGSTDVDILRAMALKMGHRVASIWDERINTFYVQNVHPETTPGSELERVEGGYGIAPKDHFNGLRKLLPEVKGLAILDNDGRDRHDSDENGLTIRYWRRYEIENYFITPELLMRYAEDRHADMPLRSRNKTVAEKVMDALIQKRVFAGSSRDFSTWKKSIREVRRLLWEAKTQSLKLSEFAEAFFRELAETSGFSILLRKGEFHHLVEFVDVGRIHPEVGERLDLLYGLFRSARAIVNVSSGGRYE